MSFDGIVDSHHSPIFIAFKLRANFDIRKLNVSVSDLERLRQRKNGSCLGVIIFLGLDQFNVLRLYRKIDMHNVGNNLMTAFRTHHDHSLHWFCGRCRGVHNEYKQCDEH